MRRNDEWEAAIENMPTPAGTHGYMQWQGTEICMDWRCSCGYQSHIDARWDFFIKCFSCEKVFAMHPHIQMIEVAIDEDDYDGVIIRTNQTGIYDSDVDDPDEIDWSKE